MLGGITAVFVGYFSVWLPGPAAGLSFLGIELGEWIKFLGVGQTRDYFYLPPITLGLVLTLLTVVTDNGRWQAWGLRITAVAVSLLAFPAIEDLTGAFRAQYMGRVWFIILVGVVVLASIWWRKWRKGIAWEVWGLMVVTGLVGLILPTWLYWQVRPAVSELLRVPVGVGLGVWLNSIGHLLITAVSLYSLYQQTRSQKQQLPLRP
ncbi:MAG: hypothetical protein D6706_00895 [Chloroflexi bacterium]|nr:MAG: hypothetical protein D6706_00895 [Chloroflexota bacterium]